jgi:uncharacterized RDD family membrane protein YckC
VRIDARVSYEGFGRRVLAGLVDAGLALMVVATAVLLTLVVGEESPRLSTLAAELPGFSTSAPWLLVVIGSAQIAFWTFLGATPGMLLLGSQVLGTDSGRNLPLPRSCLRCLGLWLGLACLGIGVLWSLRDPRHQGLHDKLARSLVVKEDESLMALDELVEGLK